MGFSGADADQLDHVGVRLESAAQSLRSKSQRLRASLNAAPWNGRGADRFRHDFNTVHARSMAEAARFLDDAYETLSRNAQEQRDASGSGHGSFSHKLGVLMERILGRLRGAMEWVNDLPWWGRPPFMFPVPMPPIFPWIPRLEPPTFPFPSLPFPFPTPRWPDHGWLLPFIGIGGIVGGAALAPKPDASKPAAPPGPSHQPSRQPGHQPAPSPAKPATPPTPAGVNQGATSGSLGHGMTDAQAQAIHDKYAMPRARGLQYQCVAWATARWQDLRAKAGLPPARVNESNGWQMASLNGGTTHTPPTLGAMASYGNGQHGSYGHVMIVEEIQRTPGGAERIRVSEMNVGDSNYEIGHPWEYQDTSWFVRQANGSWAREGGRNVGAITFAGLG